MQQLIYFLQRYKYLLFFLILEFIALGLIINNHSFHRSKFISSTNAVSGSILSKTAAISNYTNLDKLNKNLIEENNQLKNEILFLKSRETDTQKSLVDSSIYNKRYESIYGKIIKNDYQHLYNYLTINIGQKKGVYKEMAVINNKGIIGITDNTSKNYSRVQSILNKNTRINVRFKNNFYFGSLTWNGKEYNTVQLTDIPRQAIYQLGDTVVTGGKSTIFPEGIPVGRVKSIPKKITASNTLNIELFNDMSNIGYIYVIKSFDKHEVENLENLQDE